MSSTQNGPVIVDHWSLALGSQAAHRRQRAARTATRQSVSCLLAVVCGILLTVPSFSQTRSGLGQDPHTGSSPAPASPSTQPPPPPNYRLGPGDQLEILVPTHDGFNASLMVQPDGRINYPFVGEVLVTGLTVSELQERIRRGLEKELKEPQVTIFVRQVRPSGIDRVTIIGAVRSTSPVDLRENWRVSDAVSAAGGPNDRADLKHVTFWHEGKAETLDLSPILVDGRLERNPPISSGDVLIIPERPKITVSVTGGGVPSQGSFEIDDPEPTVMKALQKAGGHNEKADLKRGQLLRSGQAPQPLDLEALLLHGDMKLNLPLRNGDAIVVPILDEKIYIFGEVSRPDAYPLKPGGKVLDALSQAAPTREANLDNAVLVRKKVDGQPEARKLKLGRLNRGDLTVNLPLQNGDVILIPAKGRKLGIPDMLQILYPLQILRSMLRGY